MGKDALAENGVYGVRGRTAKRQDDQTASPETTILRYHRGEILIGIVSRISAFTAGLAAAPPTYHLFNRLIELSR